MNGASLSMDEERVLRHPELTALELQVLYMASTGNSYREIANILKVTEGHIKHESLRSQMKLGADSVTHAVAMAIRRGLIE